MAACVVGCDARGCDAQDEILFADGKKKHNNDEVHFNIMAEEDEAAPMFEGVKNEKNLLESHFKKKITKVYDVRKMHHDFDQTADSLLLALDNYKKLVKEMHSKGLVTFFASQCDLMNLPVHMVARRSFKLFTILVDDELVRNEQAYSSTKDNVHMMLEVLDLNPKINGRLRPHYHEKEKLELVTQLLILMVVQSSHDEILMLAGNSQEDQEELAMLPRMKSGSKVNLDFKQDFVLDMFLSAKLARRELKRKLTFHPHLVDKKAKAVMAPKSILDDAWEALDIDGDGFAAPSEVRQWFFSIISRPTLSVLVLQKLIHSKRHVSWASNEKLHASMLYSLPPLLIELTQHVSEETEKMWKNMDTDGDKKISKEEFCTSFPNALKRVILKPLKIKLVDRCKPGPHPLRTMEEKLTPVPETQEEENCCSCGLSRRKVDKKEHGEDSSDSEADHYLPLEHPQPA